MNDERNSASSRPVSVPQEVVDALSGAGVGSPLRVLLMGACLVIVVAGMKVASPMLVPIMVAAFLAVVCWKPIVFLHRSPFPDILAFPLVVVAVLGLVAAVGYYVGFAVNDFVVNVPFYQEQFVQRFGTIIASLNRALGLMGVEVASEQLQQLVHPERLFPFIGNTISAVGNAVSRSFVVVLIFAFILGEFQLLPLKARLIAGTEDVDLSRVDEAMEDVQQYIAVKTTVSLITGLLAGVACAIVGVPWAPLWGIVAFFLNFIPSLGSIIAAIPSTVLAFLLVGSWQALALALCYLAINTLMGNILEPRWQGRALGMSTFVVFVSLIFWGWVFGPPGMVLSIPLTMTIRLLMERSERTQWVAILLGDGKEQT